MIKSRETDFYFWVLLYENIQDLRKDVDNYNLEVRGNVDPTDKKTLGICHPFTRVKIGNDGKEQLVKNIGIIRLCTQYCGTEITSHEVVHAALWQYRLEYGTERIDGSVENADFGRSCSEKEEEFAHLYGQLYSNFVKRMYQLGEWK